MMNNNMDNLSKLFSFLDESDDSTANNTDDILISAGFEPEKIGKEFLAVANKCIAESPHNWRITAHIAHEQAVSKFHDKKSTPKPQRSRSTLIDMISSLITQYNLPLSHAYRNITNISNEDLESLLDQLEYLASEKSNNSNE